VSKKATSQLHLLLNAKSKKQLIWNDFYTLTLVPKLPALTLKQSKKPVAVP